MTFVFALEVAFTKFSHVTCLSAPLQVQEKKEELFEAFSPKFLSDKTFLCNNSDQTCFFLIHLHLLGPREVLKPEPETPPSGGPADVNA